MAKMAITVVMSVVILFNVLAILGTIYNRPGLVLTYAVAATFVVIYHASLMGGSAMEYVHISVQACITSMSYYLALQFYRRKKKKDDHRSLYEAMNQEETESFI